MGWPSDGRADVAGSSRVRGLGFVLLTCESGFGASGRAGCKSDRRRHESANSPQPGVFRSVARMDVLDGASVVSSIVVLATMLGGRHRAWG
jgi:hypothetical protein